MIHPFKYKYNLNIIQWFFLFTRSFTHHRLSNSRIFLSSPQNETSHPLNSCSPSPSPSPRQPLICTLSLWISLFWILHINGIIQYVAFCTGLLSLSIMFWGSPTLSQAAGLHFFLRLNNTIVLMYLLKILKGSEKRLWVGRVRALVGWGGEESPCPRCCAEIGQSHAFLPCSFRAWWTAHGKIWPHLPAQMSPDTAWVKPRPRAPKAVDMVGRPSPQKAEEAGPDLSHQAALLVPRSLHPSLPSEVWKLGARASSLFLSLSLSLFSPSHLDIHFTD